MVHEMTNEEFAVWCEWRKWCSVWRVKDPQPTPEELDWGLSDGRTPEQRQKDYDYLRGFVCGTLSKWLQAWYTQYKKGARVSARQQDELISAFDEYMRSGKKKDVPPDLMGKSYKDYIFYQISRSTDSPGKVLVGKIFSQKGYVREIISRYLVDTEQLDQGPRGGKRLSSSTTSMDAKLDDEGEKTLHDMLTGDGYPELNEYEDIARLLKQLKLTREEKLVLWAVSHDVAVSNPALCCVLHCKKEKAANTLKRSFEKLNEQAPELIEHCYFEHVMEIIFAELEAEEEARTFLYSIVKPEGAAE